MSTIRYIDDQNGNHVFPVTHERAVIDSDGVTLETKLGQKQDTIQDLSTIRSGAAAGATAVQPAALDAKQDVISDLQTIRSGAALGSTSVQPADIEDMVEAEPIGSIIPPVNPSEFATTEEVSQLEAKVDDLSTGKYYGYFAKEEDLPEADVDGFAYVGEGPTYTIYNLRGGVWTSSDITVNQSPIGNDEDIDQDEDGKLQFANRVYNAQQPNGMGYVILRKNKTFAEQVTGTNTIYEIRDGFTLNEPVTIPSGCVLYFNGGYVSGGSIALNGAKIVADTFGCFRSVTLSGVAGNPKMDVRIFNIFPDNSSFDTGAYIKNYLLGVDGVEWFFPAGQYYLSELWVTKANFSISGEPRLANNMTLPTIFKPFNTSQYYIIKLGGKEFSLSPTNRAIAPKIYDIQFSCSSTFEPKMMANEYRNTATYTSGLCVLDFLQVGKFAISGSSNYANIPSVLFGQIYECVFDYLLFYGATCKSDCPRLQIICSQSYSISATEIKLIMAESICGPIISTSTAAAFTEITIHQVFFEGVMLWTGGVSDVAQYGTEYVDYSQFDCVPMFNFQGFGVIRIDNISVTQINYHWKSTLDDDTEAVHYRGFIKSNLESATIDIGTIYNGGGAETLYVDNIKTYPYNYLAKIVIKNLVNCSVQQKTKAGLMVITSKIEDISVVGHKSRYLYLCPQRLFIGKELQELVYIFGTNAKVYAGAEIVQKGLEHYIVASLSQSSGADGGPFLNPNGMIVPTDYLYILTTRTSTTLSARISYRDANDNELSTEKISFVPLANILNPWFIKLNKPSNCHHIVIYNQTLGYGLNIYGIMATNEAVYARKSGTSAQCPSINSVQPGFGYFDTSYNKLFVSNGSNWVDVNNYPPAYTKGVTSQRPSAGTVGAGYTFFDTTLGKMIVSNGTAWVNMDGSALS